MNVNVLLSDRLWLDGSGKGRLESGDTYRLTLPRYVPCITEEAHLATWYDCQEDKYVVVCPQCHRLITYDTLHALCLVMAWSERQCCQGCRAKITFQQNPALIGVTLDFWYRKDAFPSSPSWAEAIPQGQRNLWAEQIRVGLEAATAPLMSAPKASLKERPADG